MARIDRSLVLTVGVLACLLASVAFGAGYGHGYAFFFFFIS
jgi:hypothetical protein